jgi:hypothetical protein
MIKFDVQFKPSAEWERQFADKQVTALEQTAAALYSDLVLSQTVPFDTGSLQNVLTYPDYTAAKDGTIRLVSSGPYARRLYYHPEYNFRTDKNPFAGGRWFDPYMAGHAKGDFVAKTFAKMIAELV